MWEKKRSIELISGFVVLSITCAMAAPGHLGDTNGGIIAGDRCYSSIKYNGRMADYANDDSHKWTFRFYECLMSQSINYTTTFCLKIDKANVTGECSPQKCSQKESSSWCIDSQWSQQWYQRPMALLDVAIWLGLAILACTATYLEAIGNRRKKTPNKVPSTTDDIVKAFSIRANARRLLKKPSGQDVIGCVYGLRFLAMLWTVVGHSYAALRAMLSNYDSLVDSLRASVITQGLIINFSLSVDAFFLLSGALTAYSWFNKIYKLPQIVVQSINVMFRFFFLCN